MLGIDELFAELADYSQYRFDITLECWARWTAEVNDRKLEQKRNRYKIDVTYRRKKSASSKARYQRTLVAAGKKPRQPSAHGSHARYRLGCRCEVCKTGESDRARVRYAARIGRTPRAYKKAA